MARNKTEYEIHQEILQEPVLKVLAKVELQPMDSEFSEKDFDAQQKALGTPGAVAELEKTKPKIERFWPIKLNPETQEVLIGKAFYGLDVHKDTEDKAGDAKKAKKSQRLNPCLSR